MLSSLLLVRGGILLLIFKQSACFRVFRLVGGGNNDRFKASPVNRTRAVESQCRAMSWNGISSVLSESVLWIFHVLLVHDAIPRHFRHDRGRRNRTDFLIPLNHGFQLEFIGGVTLNKLTRDKGTVKQRNVALPSAFQVQHAIRHPQKARLEDVDLVDYLVGDN